MKNLHFKNVYPAHKVDSFFYLSSALSENFVNLGAIKVKAPTIKKERREKTT